MRTESLNKLESTTALISQTLQIPTDQLVVTTKYTQDIRIDVTIGGLLSDEDIASAFITSKLPTIFL